MKSFNREFYKTQKIKSNQVIIENYATGCAISKNTLTPLNKIDEALTLKKINDIYFQVIGIDRSKLRDISGFPVLPGTYFFAIDPNTDNIIRYDDLYYATSYRISCFTTDRKLYSIMDYEDKLVLALPNTKEYQTKTQWYFLPYFTPKERDYISLRCIFINDDSNTKCNTKEDIYKCFSEIKSYCMLSNNLFTNPCKSWANDNKQILDNDRNFQSFLINKCKDNIDREECACIKPYILLKDKNLRAESYITYPHCVYPYCAQSSSAFRLKDQNPEKCPFVSCEYKNIDIISQDNEKTVETCKKKVIKKPKKREMSQSWSIYIIIAVIFITIVLILIVRRRQRST